MASFSRTRTHRLMTVEGGVPGTNRKGHRIVHSGSLCGGGASDHAPPPRIGAADRRSYNIGYNIQSLALSPPPWVDDRR